MIDSILGLRRFAETLRAIRNDGWSNALTGIGTPRDKTTYGSFCYAPRLNDEELRALFHQHATSKKIVSIRPREMFREGFSVDVAEDKEASKAVNNAVEMTGLVRLFRDGMIWGRLYGGALLISFLDDGRDMSEPLEDDAPIRSIESFTLIDKRYVYPETYYLDPRHPKYLQVETYTIITPTGDILNSVVHETRCIRFGGALTDDTERRLWNGWDYSVLQHVYDIVSANEQNFKSVDHLMSDLSQGVFKIKGLLAHLMSPNGEETMQTRMRLLDSSRSVARAVMLDADHGEDFTRTATPLTGVADILDRSMQRTASAAEIPTIILFGKQTQGLNNNADGEYRAFYDDIRAEQKQEAEPLLRRVLGWMFRAADGPTNGKVPEEYDLCWPRLWQPTPLEQAQIAKTYAERDQIRIQGQVWNPAEVAMAIAKNPDPDRPVEIDTEIRKTMLENEKELALHGPQEIDPVTGQPLAGTGTPATTTNGGSPGPANTKKPAPSASKGPAKAPGKPGT